MGTDRLIYIRTDGNPHIASGHLMRCFSIAQQCQRFGMTVCFLVSDKESLSLLEGIPNSDTFSVLQLQTALYHDLDRELPEVKMLLSSQHDTSVTNREILYMIDSYYVTEHYLRSLSSLVRTVYLDDLRLFDYPVDLLINYDVIPDRQMPLYRAAYRNASHLLLGASYAPLRRQFQNREIPVAETVSNILITTGGSDPYHFCLDFIHKIRTSNYTDLFGNGEIFFHIVIGSLNADRDLLFSLGEKLPFLRLHENVSDMASLMARCDLAISAAGTTLYELCALGIPALSFTMADNQLAAAKAFHEAGAIVCAGDLRKEPADVLQKSILFIKESSLSNRQAAHAIMRQLVDGSGACRIAQALDKLQRHKIEN